MPLSNDSRPSLFLGLKPYLSQTNFARAGFPLECGRTANEINAHLNRNGIIPRQFAVDSVADKLRFTAGRNREMKNRFRGWVSRIIAERGT